MSDPTLKDYEKTEGTVGLGYRVPMIIASPWTKGGFVNSEVSDHTSVLQFLEKFIMKNSIKMFM
jgi:phospholipase C